MTMRGLTLWQPMAWAIVEGHKPVENRPWVLPKAMIGQTFAVHAGKTYDDQWVHMIRTVFGLDVPAKDVIPRGAIVGVATFTGCVDHLELNMLDPEALAAMKMDPDMLEAVRAWFSGPYGFLLRDSRALPEPIPYKGMQGLWPVRPDIELEIQRQLQSLPTPLPATRAFENPRPHGQLPLLDPAALEAQSERNRVVKIIRARAHNWRKNQTASGNLVASAMEHLIEEIEA